MVNVYVDRELELNLPMVQTAEVVVVDVVVAVVAEAGLVADPHQGGVVVLQGDTTGRVQDRLTEEEDEHHPDRDLAACPRIETDETDHLHLRIDVRLRLTEEEDEHHPDRDLAACPRIETNETDH